MLQKQRLFFYKTLKKNRLNIPTMYIGNFIQIKYQFFNENQEKFRVSQGIIIAKKNTEIQKSITVRYYIDGIGLEQKFFLDSPNIHSINILKLFVVKRAKLYYLRKNYWLSGNTYP